MLLATNIVESGLDIPRANTIVVCWPEKFGLAQLHQLRGRVGRGGIRAFAHLLTETQSGQSAKRLSVLEEFSRPGAGFAISARRSRSPRRGRPVFGGAIRPRPGVRARALQPSAEDGLREGRRRPPRDVGARPQSADRGHASRKLRAVGAGAARTLCAHRAMRQREDELDDLEEETARRFGPLPQMRVTSSPPRGCGWSASAGASSASTSAPGRPPRPSCRDGCASRRGGACSAMAIASSITAPCARPRSTGSRNCSNCSTSPEPRAAVRISRVPDFGPAIRCPCGAARAL